ncbi:inositol polyphosphate-4-phosphatase type I A-like isoform X1 [Styela clava]
MRYNASELKQMAITSAKLCAKEGVLSLREKEGKLWNKTDVLTERWCRLVDNLFFYFKTKDMGSDPHGVFVLEGSHVRPVSDSTQECAFILEFDGDNRSTYFLASEPAEAKQWIKALEDANYTKLKEKYEMLMKQQNMLGESSQQNLQPPSSMPQTIIKETRSANSSPMLSRRKLIPKDYNMTLSDVEVGTETKKKKMKVKNRRKNVVLSPVSLHDSVLPVLELGLSCVDLNIAKTIDHKRSIQIRVFSLLPPATDLTQVFKTDQVKAASDVHFVATLSFYQSHLITPHTVLRFVLVQKKENGTIDTLGFTNCNVSDFFYLTKPLTLSLEYQDNTCIGVLNLTVHREYVSAQLTRSSSETQLSTVLLSHGSPSSDANGLKVDASYGDIGQVPNLKSLYCEAISRTYKFPTTNKGFLSVQEIMLETRLSFHVPLEYLKLLIDQETRFIGTLNSIKYLVDYLQQTKIKQAQNKEKLIQQYQEGVKNIVDRRRGPSFKASMQKTEKEYEFIPTNLHLQRMRVQHSDCISASTPENTENASSSPPVRVYDIITVGAATAHCFKYKQGGLLSLMSSSSEKVKKGRELALTSLCNQENLKNDIAELPVTISDLQKEVKSHISTIETLILAGKECNTVPTRTSAEMAVTMLSDKTCLLVSLLDNEDLCKALSKISNDLNGSSSAGNSLLNASTKLVSGSSLEWEELKSSVKTKLSEIIAKVHTMLDNANLVEIDDLASNTVPDYDSIVLNLNELETRLSTVCNLAMQGHAIHSLIHIQGSTDLIYRRDVVFSQVLSSCVCGVSTALFSFIHDTEYLNNISNHGMLIHFESLLSTYKNELGMLEDHVVGIYDLHKVSFCCEKSKEQDGDDMDHLLPTIHGTRNRITVRLHLDPQTFVKLPDSLRSGAPFKVVPVLFNIGINEEQTLAEKIGSTSLQDCINVESLSRLSSYSEKIIQNSMTSQAGEIESKLNKLKEAINFSKKNKNVEILHLSSEISRMLKGVRVTSCKSAKDRTAMSVTLEQVQILINNHQLSPNEFSRALNCMRSEGTRRENTRKNVGVRKYAFTSVQLMTFPKLYRPPDGTYGKSES